MPEVSIREQIAEAVKNRLTGMTVPAYQIAFDHVQRQELDSSLRGKNYVAAVFDDLERKDPEIGHLVYSTIEMAIELVGLVERDETPNTVLNLMLLEVEKAIRADRTFGGLAIDTQILRSQNDIKGRFDKYVETTLFIAIKYRHNNENPSQVN